MKWIAMVLIVAFCLGGCASDGTLVNGFLPYYTDEGPHLWIGRTIVNAVLLATYVTVGAAYIVAEAYVRAGCCEPCR